MVGERRCKSTSASSILKTVDNGIQHFRLPYYVDFKPLRPAERGTVFDRGVRQPTTHSSKPPYKPSYGYDMVYDNEWRRL